MKKLSLLWLLYFLSSNLAAQNGYTDSLKQRLASAKEDTAKVELLDALSSGYTWSYSDTGIMYGRQGLQLAQKIKYHTGELRCMVSLGNSLTTHGDYIQALDITYKALSLFKVLHDTAGIRRSYKCLSICYREQADYKRALAYAREDLALGMAEHGSVVVSEGILASIFERDNQLDSALLYGQKAYEGPFYAGFKDPKEWSGLLYVLGATHAKMGHHDRALYFYRNALRSAIKNNFQKDILDTYNGMARVCLSDGRTDSAIYYTKQVIGQKWSRAYPLGLLDASILLTNIYESKNIPDSTLKYLKETIQLKDSLFNREKGRLVAYNYEQRIELMNKEKEIQQARFQKESLWKNILIVAVLILLLLGFIVFRNVLLLRKNEMHRRKLAENELQLQKMQVLRAQMSPHFIFNSLNSVNHFILQNDRIQASEYLTKFSKLVRLILQNSQAAYISLECEIEALQLYLELEAVRFDHQFDYKIKIDDVPDISVLRIPPLIIQPFAENAIWHGLMQKEEKGSLEIQIVQRDDILYCTVKDDGVGRKKAAELKSKSASAHKSMGIRITGDRIALLQREKGDRISIQIMDLTLADGSAGGTEVLIKLPVQYD